MNSSGNDLRNEAALAARHWMRDHLDSEVNIRSLLPLAHSLLRDESRDPVETIRDAQNEIYRGFRLGALAFASESLNRINACSTQMAMVRAIAEARSQIILRTSAALQRIDDALNMAVMLLAREQVGVSEESHLKRAVAALKLTQAITMPSASHSRWNGGRTERPDGNAADVERAKARQDGKRPTFAGTPA